MRESFKLIVDRFIFFYLDDLAFSAEHEPEHHLPLLVIDVSELNTDRRMPRLLRLSQATLVEASRTPHCLSRSCLLQPDLQPSLFQPFQSIPR